METTSPYTTGQTVEVLRTDFSTPGFPSVWVAGVVAAVRQITPVVESPRKTARGVWDVTVQLSNGAHTVEMVGPRGGGKAIRVAA